MPRPLRLVCRCNYGHCVYRYATFACKTATDVAVGVHEWHYWSGSLWQLVSGELTLIMGICTHEPASEQTSKQRRGYPRKLNSQVARVALHQGPGRGPATDCRQQSEGPYSFCDNKIHGHWN